MRTRKIDEKTNGTPTPITPVKSMLAKAAETLPTNNSPFVAEPLQMNHVQRLAAAQEPGLASPQQAPGATASVGNPAGNGSVTGRQNAQAKDKRPKAASRKKSRNDTGTPASREPPPVMNSDVSRNGNDMNASVKRGKGWRQTPLLQPSPQPSSEARSSAKGSGRKKNRRQMQEEQDMQNGWATEDATDIQDLPEFDFEANHKLFDKKTVFDELRAGDTTADEDLLVTHNKLPPRPGTHGGKNLHPTESVLSPKIGSQDVDSTSDADTELNFATGHRSGSRSASRHSATRKSMPKKKPSRQGSALLDDGRAKPHPLSASVSSDRGLERSVASLAGSSRSAKQMSAVTSSPKPDRVRSPQSAVSTKVPEHTFERTEARLMIQPSRAPCPVLHPSALEMLEEATVKRFKLTAEAITESAARAIAEMAMSITHTAGDSRRGSRANTLRGSMTTSTRMHSFAAPTTIVILCGDHTTGARAVAAARHLLSRHIDVIICDAQFNKVTNRDPQMHDQTKILQRVAQAGAPVKRAKWQKAFETIKQLPGPPAIIIDALLGGSPYNAALGTATEDDGIRAMIDWANRSRAPVLSVACPAGVSGIDGSATMIEGEPLAVRPDKVLCLGAPTHGVLEAMKNGERWDVSVADIGINIALRSEEAVAFGSSWVSPLNLVEDDGLIE